MTAPLAPAPREAFEARLAGVACREDGVSVAQLEADGWTIASEPNPMRIRHGAGPDGVKCATCCDLMAVHGHTRTYYKCVLRGVSSGAATDHRRSWLACSAYVPAPPRERP